KTPLNHHFLSFIIYQILCAVNHLHRENIIHRDLKPENIAIKEEGFHVKVLDFGLARIYDASSSHNMTTYVVTRYNLAPEVILNHEKREEEQVDVWSIGCIFSELITREVLFQGHDNSSQWDKIVEILGTPSEEFLGRVHQESRGFSCFFSSQQIG
ncbi:hypothetical protein PMAYCL1PPCAC_22348, partial [Pristionchus mayeri]